MEENKDWLFWPCGPNPSEAMADITLPSLSARGWHLSYPVHRPSDIPLFCSPCGSCFQYTLCRRPGHHLRSISAPLREGPSKGERWEWGRPQSMWLDPWFYGRSWWGVVVGGEMLVKMNTGGHQVHYLSWGCLGGRVTGEAVREAHDVGRGGHSDQVLGDGGQRNH